LHSTPKRPNNSGVTSRRITGTGHVVGNNDNYPNEHKILVGKSQGKRLMRQTWVHMEGNQADLRDVGYKAII
jgi:hypothetical protein